MMGEHLAKGKHILVAENDEDLHVMVCRALASSDGCPIDGTAG